MPPFLHNSRFWSTTIVTVLVAGTLFAWLLNIFAPLLPGPPRPPAPLYEVIASIVIVLLLSINMGLLSWQQRYGTCPTGTKTATGIAGVIGAITLICPACVLGTAGFAGVLISLAFLSPFLPLLQIIAVILLAASMILQWPRTTPPSTTQA